MFQPILFVTIIRLDTVIGENCTIYRVSHKSVKHFKNSQQINYSTDRGSSYADRERNTLQVFFLHIS